jgi:signal transduction histidine kinase
MEGALGQKQDVIGAMEAERRHLGEQIHDSLCQTLTSVSLLLERMRMAAQSGKPASLDSIEFLRQQVETAIREARQLSRRFAPVELQGASLLDALQSSPGNFPAWSSSVTKPCW